MPNYIQLISKETQEQTSFIKIDEEICAHFGFKVDPEKYVGGWYDAICGRAAFGKSFEEIKAEFEGYTKEYEGVDAAGVSYYQTMIKILDFIAERYATNAWFSRSK